MGRISTRPIIFVPLLLMGGNLVTTGAAWAQSADAGAISGSAALSGSLSGAVSGSTSNANSSSNSSSNSGAASGSASKSVGVGGGATINQNSPAADLGRGVPNVYASPLVAGGSDVCLGSLTGGGSAAGFGLSLGTTLEDKSCQLRSYARSLAILGYPQAAREEICQDPSVRAAMVAAGTPCAADRGGPVALAGSSTQVSQVETAPVNQQASVARPVDPSVLVASARPAGTAPVDKQVAVAGPVDPSALVDTYPPSAPSASGGTSASGGNCHQEYQVFYGWQKVCN
jgi:hypothetical protein